ncbi:M23 family metallopeptidase [Sphingobacterium endophyticum]|uniref:M23 family metallopeptidase n=1 Tax=Sphingobacterium endophyticum TaxID=2546448 RepID=UPI0012E28571|nr:M23 family metallopeptidase [Sphingobacterium endophyticum]
MTKKKTAIEIIDSNGDSNLKIQIPTILLKNWKYILAGGIFTICLICATIVYVATKSTSNHYEEQLSKQIEALEEARQNLALEEATNQLSTVQIQKSFDAIDSAVNQINAKMRKRGLKEFAPKIKNAGGPVENEVNLNEMIKFYEATVKKLDKKLEGVPLGKPHNGNITSRFGYRRNPFTNRGIEMHSGIDISGRTGEAINATAAGKVVFSGYKGQYGNVVIIEHTNGWETRYAHLSRTLVKKGQKIEAGQQVGKLGSTGRSTGPHLHYELLSFGRKINPEKTLIFN